VASLGPRTLLDLAGVLGDVDLARAVDRAERLDLFDLAAVDEALARARGRRGAAALRRAVVAWRPRRTRSELEDRYLELLKEAGLPMPRFNVLLEGELATHEVDAFWPSRRLVVQLDGFAYHRTRRDRERDAATDADFGARRLQNDPPDLGRRDRSPGAHRAPAPALPTGEVPSDT
jgi:very-short-patch-repair endonuclease